MTDAAAIIDRLRAATGPDRELDQAIAIWHRNAICVPGKPRVIAVANCKPYTASLDAALTLVDDDCLAMWRELWDGGGKSGAACVTRYSSAPARMWLRDYSGDGATPAIALCIAALLARQAAEAASDD